MEQHAKILGNQNMDLIPLKQSKHFNRGIHVAGYLSALVLTQPHIPAHHKGGLHAIYGKNLDWFLLCNPSFNTL